MSAAPEAEQRSQLLARLSLERRTPSRPSRKGPAVAVVVGALLLAAVAWRALRSDFTAPVLKTAIARDAAAAGPGASVLDASGYVTARRQATVSAKITGKVLEVMIEEGMHVDEGALLARLDATEAVAQLELSRAQLTAARSQVEEIRSRLAQAERDLARHQDLARRLVSSTQELERSKMERDALAARLVNAGDQIETAEKQVALAEVQLADTEIRAPFSGVVVAKAAQPGEMISPISAGGGFTRTGIGTIVDMDSLEIEVDVNESFINRVTAAQPVEAVLNAYPDWKIAAEVIAVVPTADRSKATVKVRIAIKAGDARIVPDMGVRVSFLRSAAERAGMAAGTVAVPAASVVAEGDKHVVFVVRGGKVEKRVVTVAGGDKGEQQVSRGLVAGDNVVVSPPAGLRDGDAAGTAAGD